MAFRKKRTAMMLVTTSVVMICYLVFKDTRSADTYSEKYSSLGIQNQDLPSPNLAQLKPRQTSEPLRWTPIQGDSTENILERPDYDKEGFDDEDGGQTTDYETEGEDDEEEDEDEVVDDEENTEEEEQLGNGAQGSRHEGTGVKVTNVNGNIENNIRGRQTAGDVQVEVHGQLEGAGVIQNGQESQAVVQQQQQPDVHLSHLLIVAYMRTGSSMTGRILQFSPQVFYWYEPLHSLERYYVTGGNPHSPYRNKTMNEMFKESSMAGGNISAVLSCDIPNVYNLTLLDGFMTFGRHGTGPFLSCFRQAITPQQWRLCQLNMSAVCRQKFKVTAAKSIRLHMSRAVDVARRDPKVKVVHLIRDPRAVLNSRRPLGFADFNNLESEAGLLCSKFKDDLRQAEAASDVLQSRYMLVRYEDIAAVPMEHTQQLYKLMGLAPSESVLSEVRRMMDTAKKRRTCPTCRPTPLNSTEVSQAWRQTMTFHNVSVISKVCADVLKMLGYKEGFESEAELRDLRISAVRPIPLPH